MRAEKRVKVAITATASEEITEGNFYQKCQEFLSANPRDWVMARPDRPNDEYKNRYRSHGDRLRGDAILQDWLDYFAAKRMRAKLRTWPALILSGHSLQFPCADPKVFDLSYIPGSAVANARDFWNRLRAEREVKPQLTEEQIAARKAKAERIAAEFARKNAMKTKAKPDSQIGDSLTPADAIPWEERARLYRDNPSRLSQDAAKTRAGLAWEENSEA